MPITIGQKIKAHREEKKLTQEQLAHLAHVTRTTIVYIETGRRKHDPNLATLKSIASALRVDVAALIGGGE